MDRFAFLSDGWLDAMKHAAQRLFDEGETAPAARFSYAEIFTNIPADLKSTTPVGYVLSFADRKVDVTKASSEDEPADCRVMIDYDIALATTRLNSGPDMDALIKRAFADKTMTISGSAKDIPIDMGKLHDALTERTATGA